MLERLEVKLWSTPGVNFRFRLLHTFGLTTSNRSQCLRCVATIHRNDIAEFVVSRREGCDCSYTLLRLPNEPRGTAVAFPTTSHPL